MIFSIAVGIVVAWLLISLMQVLVFWVASWIEDVR